MAPKNKQDDPDSDSSTEDIRIRPVGAARNAFQEFRKTGEGLDSIATVTRDGRIVVSLDLKRKLPDLPKEHAKPVEEFAVDDSTWKEVPELNIVIMIVGSRGDVQPYVALGRRLQKDGHRIRIASHETFRGFVTEQGLEFYDIGGNPQDLMSYMVKNPGLMPGFDSLTNGDIGRKRTMLKEMIHGCWDACHMPCQKTKQSFIADAIISNPPSFAHIHCAEALGIPLQLTFTMPWCSTTAFPHPLVNVKTSNAEEGLTNYLTYALAELLTWQGVGDIVNNFRKKKLGLKSLSFRSGPGLAETLKVPWTYCMSPALVPKPQDWMNHIDVVGFYFLDLASSYSPPDDLAGFLAAGSAPVYIGFGSVVIEDPKKMTDTIFEATRQAGVRALVSAGWGGLGGMDIPSHVFILGNVPHDWLFGGGRVSAVIHHGGAGTTSAGLAHGLPTLVVPFFGDQGFWGSMIHKAGAGPEPIKPKKLSVENLAEAIRVLESDEAKFAAGRMGEQIRAENGVERGVESFYKHLPLKNMRCDIQKQRLAAWWSTEHCLKFSTFAAQVLSDAKEIDMNTLELHRPKEYDSRKPVTDPITGGGAAIFWTVSHYYASIAEIFYAPVKGITHTTTAIPKGVWKIVTSVQEEFHNMPKMYGSEVREPGKVKDFKSGVIEGGKGVVMGYYDGITGLVREPYEGAKKEGFMGAIKGAGRSWVNVTMKPAAGIVGAIVHPMNGLWKSAIPGKLGPTEVKQRGVRMAEGMKEVKSSERRERDAVLKTFKELKKTTPERREKMVVLATQVMQEREEAKERAQGELTPMSTGSSSNGKQRESLPPYSRGSSSLDEKMAALGKEKGSLNSDEKMDSEAAFLRDLELAMYRSKDSIHEDDEQMQEDLEQAKKLSLMEASGSGSSWT